MMKVAILTFNTATNFGAQLQAYALQKTLTDMGFEALHIRRGLASNSHSFKSVVKSKLSGERDKKYEEFTNNILRFYPGSYTRETVYQISDDFDAFVSGSDQVWNVKNGIDPVWFQDFVPDDKLKISYAASLGIDHIPLMYAEQISKRLDSFDYISVREKSSVEELGKFTDNKVSWNIDPVFLVSAGEWSQMAGEPIEKEPYIFVYGTQMSDEFKQIALKLKKETGLKLLSVFRMNGAKTVEYSCGPIEFVNYIKNAEYVVTTSFHATAFSIIFHKNLIEYLHSSTGSRARGILSLFHQEGSIVSAGEKLPEEWNYEDTDRIIAEQKEISITYLRSALSGKKCQRGGSSDHHLDWLGKPLEEDVIGNPDVFCTGCGMCSDVCPVCAISMVQRDNGFLYPSIDDDTCIHCNLCHKNCPSVNQQMKSDTEIQKIYALKSLDDNVISKCSSGGAFIHLSDKFLDKGGIIYGCMFNDSYEAVIGRAETKEERDLFCGSKYVQSNASGSYAMVCQDLKAGRKVMFSGVPCQVNALKTFLAVKNVDTENLFLIDLICHGCPSPAVWQKHLADIRRKYGDAGIETLTFRKKDEHGNNQALYIKFANEKEYFARSGHDLYYSMFLKNYILRPSCYSCRFTSTSREGDITIADWWGGYRVNPEFMSDNKGCSQVMVNSEKGMKLFSEIIDDVCGMEIKLEDGMQPNLQYPTPQPVNYDSFQRGLKSGGLENAAKEIASKKDKLRMLLGKAGLNEVVYRMKNN